MRERVIGPYRGYYAVITVLVVGPRADQYIGWGKVFTRLPVGMAESGEIADVNCREARSTADDALDDAENTAMAAIDALPPHEGSDESPTRLSSLIYVSRASGALNSGELEHLLLRARARNRDHGLTGALLYFDETFMQYLEGPDSHLNLIYHIIRHDPMHSGPIKIMRRDITKRVYKDWSMGFDSASSDVRLLGEVGPVLRARARHEATVHATLTAFVERSSARAGLRSPENRHVS